MARTYACTYTDEEQLEQFIIDHKLNEESRLSIQTYSEVADSVRLARLKDAVQRLLPQQPILDCSYTSEGENKDILLSFTVVEKSTAKLSSFATEEPTAINESINIDKTYKTLFTHTSDAVFSTNLKGQFISINPAMENIFGIVEKDFVGRPALFQVREEEATRWKKRFHLAIQGDIQNGKLTVLSKKGTLLRVELRLIPIIVNGETVEIHGIARNLTEQKQMKEKITRLAFYDSITGLPNRLKFTTQLEEEMSSADDKQNLAVLFIDLDRFKVINGSLGHATGDQILKQSADRIKLASPTSAYMGRFAGDKFTIILTKNSESKEVMRTANEILKALTKVIIVDGQEIFITASVGISFYSAETANASMLLRNADTAMNMAKNEGGNRITFFSNEMQKQARKRLKLESNLRKAVQNDEFYLCYQPLADIRTGKVYGSEALIRWKHPELGLVAPGDFIPLAEEIGLIEEIGTWVLLTACMQNKLWQAKGLEKLIISVNVSAHQFQQPNFVEKVKQALFESGLEPHYLHLELTESMMIGNIEYSVSVMKVLQVIGVKVSIDDFGTGYSSLSYLKLLPIDTLKIDRSFINNIKDASDIAIIKAIITMGQGMNLEVIAEGVETKEQMEILKELDCHFAQGFYIHKPLTIQQFETDLKNQAEA